jgi:hypothetical protein
VGSFASGGAPIVIAAIGLADDTFLHPRIEIRRNLRNGWHWPCHASSERLPVKRRPPTMLPEWRLIHQAGLQRLILPRSSALS